MTSYHHSQMTNYTQVCTRVSWLLATHVQLLHISIIITCRQCTVTIAHMPASAAAHPPWFTSSAQQTHCECKHKLASLTQTDSTVWSCLYQVTYWQSMCVVIYMPRCFLKTTQEGRLPQWIETVTKTYNSVLVRSFHCLQMPSSRNVRNRQI